MSAGPAGADAVSARTLWRAAIVGGAGLLVVGVVLIAWPHATGVVLAVLAGSGMLWFGCLDMIGALLDRPDRGWALRFARGLLGVVAGAVVLAWPHQTVLVVAVVLGLWMLTQGAFAVVGRLMHPPRYPRGAGTVGILGMVAGLFLVGQPARSLHAGAIVLGSVLVCLGVIELVAGLVAWTRDRRHRADGSVAVTA
ncbi:MAG TPA: DUF308 domain-containing protein [Acidimicrobiia bacterium]|nr:DUF308 domain-containing protein [Acidimicrobiia bacterium]